MKDPAVLFYTSDFLTGTSFFTMEQRGQYITLLCQQHQLGLIPKNHMISVCGSLDSPVVKKFNMDKNGDYYNERMRNEAIKRREFCKSRSNNLSGRKKKVKNKSHKDTNDKHMGKHMENENINVNIIEYLNKKCNTNYRATTEKTQKLIKARMKEGFKIDDFKKVIDIKSKQWLKDIEMCKYLRPETLFGTKFEGYLNEKEIKVKPEEVYPDKLSRTQESPLPGTEGIAIKKTAKVDESELDDDIIT